MTAAEAAALLAVAAAFDNRKPDADAATAWALALQDAAFTDCRDAIVAHYRAGNEWLMPSHVIAGVRRLRDKRLHDYGPIVPPPGFDPDDVAAYLTWLEDTTRAIADGTLTPPPPVEVTGRDVVAELGHVGRAMPSRAALHPEPVTPEPNPHVDALRAELSTTNQAASVAEEADHG